MVYCPTLEIASASYSHHPACASLLNPDVDDSFALGPLASNVKLCCSNASITAEVDIAVIHIREFLYAL